MPPPAISKQPSIKPRRSSGVHGAIDKSAVPGESVEELKRRVAVLEQEKEKEERARNHAELEKFRILDFWDVTRSRLAAAEATVRQMSLQLEQQQSEHAAEIKSYSDRIRALVAAHAADKAEAMAAATATLQQRTAEQEAALLTVQEEHRTALHEARSKQEAAEHAAAACQLECDRQLREQRWEYEKQVTAVQLQYDSKLQDAISIAEGRCQSSMHEAAQQRDAALSEASLAQSEMLREIREQQAATVAAQLDLISALKGDVAAAKQREAVALEESRKVQEQHAAS